MLSSQDISRNFLVAWQGFSSSTWFTSIVSSLEMRALMSLARQLTNKSTLNQTCTGMSLERVAICLPHQKPSDHTASPRPLAVQPITAKHRHLQTLPLLCSPNHLKALSQSDQSHKSATTKRPITSNHPTPSCQSPQSTPPFTLWCYDGLHPFLRD